MSAAGKRYMARVAEAGCVLRGRPPKPKKEKICDNCGKIFLLYPSQIRKYCCLNCRDEHKVSKRLKDGKARCSRCKCWKPEDEFVTGSRKRSDGTPYKVVHSHCRECNRAWHEARRRKLGQKPKSVANEESKRRRAEYKYWHNRISTHNRRAAGKMPTKWEIGKMLCSQDARCTYCGELLPIQYHIDHKLPVSRGGTNAEENLHLTCPKCNLRKGTMTHEEFLTSKKRRVRSVPWK